MSGFNDLAVVGDRQRRTLGGLRRGLPPRPLHDAGTGPLPLARGARHRPPHFVGAPARRFARPGRPSGHATPDRHHARSSARDFTGRWHNAAQPVDDLHRHDFGDRAASVIVSTGAWEVCADALYGGGCAVLLPGQYPSLAQMGLEGRISSLRHSDRGAREQPGQDRDGAVTFYEGENLTGPFVPRRPGGARLLPRRAVRTGALGRGHRHLVAGLRLAVARGLVHDPAPWRLSLARSDGSAHRGRIAAPRSASGRRQPLVLGPAPPFGQTAVRRTDRAADPLSRIRRVHVGAAPAPASGIGRDAARARRRAGASACCQRNAPRLPVAALRHPSPDRRTRVRRADSRRASAMPSRPQKRRPSTATAGTPKMPEAHRLCRRVPQLLLHLGHSPDHARREHARQCLEATRVVGVRTAGPDMTQHGVARVPVGVAPGGRRGQQQPGQGRAD